MVYKVKEKEKVIDLKKKIKIINDEEIKHVRFWNCEWKTIWIYLKKI